MEVNNHDFGKQITERKENRNIWLQMETLLIKNDLGHM